MEGVVEADWGLSVGNASVGYRGANERVRF